jgi:hypothetical protein
MYQPNELLDRGGAHEPSRRARHALSWVRRQLVHVVPAYVFFFVAFNIIVQTQALMVGREHAPEISVVLIAVAAGIVAKVVLLVDNLPFIDLFGQRPLIYNTLWKTLVYSAGALVVRFGEHAVEFAIRFGGLSVGLRHYLAEWPWHMFWAVQVWYTALFLVFAAFGEIGRALGGARLRHMFLG